LKEAEQQRDSGGFSNALLMFTDYLTIASEELDLFDSTKTREKRLQSSTSLLVALFAPRKASAAKTSKKDK